MRIFKPFKITSKIIFPCDLCGDKVKTISIYLKAKAKSKIVEGFYSDLVVHLCEDCIDKMKEKLNND